MRFAAGFTTGVLAGLAAFVGWLIWDALKHSEEESWDG